jgi:hypothetical protein
MKFKAIPMILLTMFMLTSCPGVTPTTAPTVPPTATGLSAPTITPTTLATLPPTATGLPATTITSTSAQPILHSTPRFQVFILTPLSTCLVGNEYASGNVCRGSQCGDCNCAWEDQDPHSPQTGVQPEHVNDPQYAAFKYRDCLEITLSDQEIDEIKADMQLVRDLAYQWSGGALDLQLEFTILPHAYTGFTAPDFVIGPFEIDDELLNEYVTTQTDFVYVVTGVYDRAQGKRLAYWCGSSYGDLSVHGASYSYIQYNHEACNSVTIAGKTIYEPLIHEWVHNLDWALYYINGVPDIYQDVGPDWGKWEHASWPACGTGSLDPLDWFPSVDLCEWDPDWRDCNNVASAGACLHAGEVDGAVSWYEHVISAHYPRTTRFIGNFCRDGRQDFSETGVDSGSPCP